LGVGGRDGQSGTWGLDIDEGPPERRQWDVNVTSYRAAVREDRTNAADRRRQDDEAAFLAAMTRYPHGTTKGVLRTVLSWSGQKVKMQLSRHCWQIIGWNHVRFRLGIAWSMASDFQEF
jgi:hypothetical protein